MSLLLIRQALETRLNTLSPSIQTAWENVEYQATSQVPWQKVYLLPNNVDSPTFAGDVELVHELGLLQISLHYPLNQGMKNVQERSELLRSHFPKGLSLVAGSVTVHISKRASVAPANRDGEWLVLPVTIPWFSYYYAIA